MENTWKLKILNKFVFYGMEQVMEMEKKVQLPAWKFITNPSSLETQVCTSNDNEYQSKDIYCCNNGLCKRALQIGYKWMQINSMQPHEGS